MLVAKVTKQGDFIDFREFGNLFGCGVGDSVRSEQLNGCVNDALSRRTSVSRHKLECKWYLQLLDRIAKLCKYDLHPPTVAVFLKSNYLDEDIASYQRG